MEWFSQNWVWVLFFIGFVAMRMFGHGGHGGHGGSRSDSHPAGKDPVPPISDQGQGHRH